jgi:L-amino acid N-acyltransferase YncA
MHIHFQHLDNHFILRLLKQDDSEALFLYFNELSEQTKAKYAPHSFDKTTVEQICQNYSKDIVIRFVVEDSNKQIIAYFLFKKGIFDYEFIRISEKGIQLPRNSSFDFAPSIADAHQGAGLGKEIFRLCINEIKILGCTHLVLWGGVQKGNEKAVKYYQKLGFQIVNEFEHNGQNYDMTMILT